MFRGSFNHDDNDTDGLLEKPNYSINHFSSFQSVRIHGVCSEYSEPEVRATDKDPVLIRPRRSFYWETTLKKTHDSWSGGNFSKHAVIELAMLLNHTVFFKCLIQISLYYSKSASGTGSSKGLVMLAQL